MLHLKNKKNYDKLTWNYFKNTYIESTSKYIALYRVSRKQRNTSLNRLFWKFDKSMLRKVWIFVYFLFNFELLLTYFMISKMSTSVAVGSGRFLYGNIQFFHENPSMFFVISFEILRVIDSRRAQRWSTTPKLVMVQNKNVMTFLGTSFVRT